MADLGSSMGIAGFSSSGFGADGRTAPGNFICFYEFLLIEALFREEEGGQGMGSGDSSRKSLMACSKREKGRGRRRIWERSVVHRDAEAHGDTCCNVLNVPVAAGRDEISAGIAALQHQERLSVVKRTSPMRHSPARPRCSPAASKRLSKQVQTQCSPIPCVRKRFPLNCLAVACVLFCSS